MDGLTEIYFEIDGETVTDGVVGEAWRAVYRVPAHLADTDITEVEAEQYGAPRFEKATN